MSVKSKHRQDAIKVKLRRHRQRAAKLGLRADYVTAGQWKSKVLALGAKCIYCKRSEGKDERLTFDHLHPISRGGGHFLENLVPACMRCNRAKSDKLIHEWKPRHALSRNKSFIPKLWDSSGSCIELPARPAESDY